MEDMLPDDFVISGLELAKGYRLFGIRFDDMTRDELIAAAAHGWNEDRKQRENYYKIEQDNELLFRKLAKKY